MLKCRENFNLTLFTGSIALFLGAFLALQPTVAFAKSYDEASFYESEDSLFPDVPVREKAKSRATRLDRRAKQEEKNMTAGVQVGPHITYADRVEKLQTDFPSGQAGQSRVAPMAGVYGEYLVVPFVAGRVELNYVQKGFSIPFNLNGTAGNVDLMLHYVELPIFLKAQYRIGRVTPFVLAGGSAAYLVSAEGAGYYGSKEISAKISDGYFGIFFRTKEK
jgi:hypothetical protein